jgi:hypothetical protein
VKTHIAGKERVDPSKVNLAEQKQPDVKAAAE